MAPIKINPPSRMLLHAARQLWFSSYSAVLSTHSVTQPGFPFGSLVPLCRSRDGLPLLLFSHLAQHTLNLDANSNCSLTMHEEGKGDIQKLRRLTCLAQAEKVDSAPSDISERFFRFFPDNRAYFEELNFHFYRMIPEQFYFIGGFGAARWFDSRRIIPETLLSEDEEGQLLAMLEARYQTQGEVKTDVKALGADSMGFELASGESITRVMFKEPADTPSAFLHNLENT